MSIRNKKLSDFQERNFLYSDGITKITDPFWKNTCKDCDHTFLSCDSTSVCPECGSSNADRRLSGVPYDQIIKERGEPKVFMR